MSTALSHRIEALEALPVRSRRGGVLLLRAGESSEDGIRRAQAEGRCGAFLIVPAEMGEAEWEQATKNTQRELAFLASVVVKGAAP